MAGSRKITEPMKDLIKGLDFCGVDTNIIVGITNALKTDEEVVEMCISDRGRYPAA